MRTSRAALCATLLLVLGSAPQFAEACTATYLDFNVNTAQSKIEAWSWVEDYYNFSPCFDEAYWALGWWSHSYHASVHITSPTQNLAYHIDSLPNVDYGGGSASAYASLSYVGESGLYDIVLESWIDCNWSAMFAHDYRSTTAMLFEIRYHHPTTSLTNPEIDSNIFPAATQLLQNWDGQGDVACPIVFWRFGPIVSFTEGNGTIIDLPTLEEVFAVAGHAKVVNEIHWCNGPKIATGCSGWAGMVLVRTPSLEGNNWAHEYGHSVGLWLPPFSSHGTDPYFLSHELIQSSARRVTASECNAMRNPV
jgi:hypothetical protein